MKRTINLNNDEVYSEAVEYNELQEYLNHQESWLEAELGSLYFNIKKEMVEIDEINKQ